MHNHSLTLPNVLKLHDWVWIPDTIFQVKNFDKTDARYIELEHHETKETTRITVGELFSSNNGKPAIFATSFESLLKKIIDSKSTKQIAKPASGLDLSESLVNRADKMIRICKSIEELTRVYERDAYLNGEKFEYTKALIKACTEMKTSKSAYYKYEKICRNSQWDRIVIAASLQKITFNQIKISPSAQHLVDTIIIRFYLNDELRLKPSKVFKLVMDVLEKRTRGTWINVEKCNGDIPENLVDELLSDKIPIQVFFDNPEKRNLLIDVDAPGRTWFYQYLRWYTIQADPDGKWFKERYGEDVYEREFLVFDNYLKKATIPLQYVFLDHCLLPIFIIDEKDPDRRIRIWLTVLIDVYSRSILGFAISTQCATIDALQSAIKMAIWPKEKLLERYDIKLPWNCYGLFTFLSLDNAWSHHSHSLARLSSRITQEGFSLHWRPPYKGRFGGIIERYIQNIKSELAQLGKSTFSAKNPKQIRSAAKEAFMFHEDLYKKIVQLIVNYQNTIHSELGGMTPEQKWQEGLNFVKHIVPDLNDETDRLFWILHPETRQIGQKGISVFGDHYYSRDIQRAKKLDVHGKRIDYSISINPQSVGEIALSRDGKWICDGYSKKLRLPDRSLKVVSLAEFNIASDICRARYGAGSSVDWLEFYGETVSLRKQRKEEQRGSKRQRGGGGHKNSENKAKGEANELSDYELTRLLSSFSQ